MGEKKRRRAIREKEELKEKEEEDAWAKLKREAIEAERARSAAAPSWVVLGARCAWFSQTVQRFMPVTITAADVATGAVTVSFDNDPSACKEVPLTLIGDEGVLRPPSI